MCKSYFVGRLTGKKAVQVLRVRNIGDSVETEKRVDLILNRKTAAAGQFQLSRLL